MLFKQQLNQKKCLSLSAAVLLFLIMTFASTSFASHKNPSMLLVIEHPKLINLVKAHNGKTVVVFWAPWCPYCKKEVKLFNENSAFFKENNLNVILLSPPEDTEDSIRFLSSINNSFPAYARDSSLKRKLRVTSIPDTFVFTSDGKVYDRERGAKDMQSLKYMIEEY